MSVFDQRKAYPSRRAILAPAAIGLASVSLTACGGTMFGGDTPTAPQPAVPAPVPGAGGMRIGLVLPLTGNGAVPGGQLKNAAELALAQFESPEAQLIVKDDQSSPQGAQAATQAALAEGADIILGPLFARDVQAAGQIAKAAGKPVIAFSSDSSAASKGVYILGFMPETQVERIVEFAARSGKRAMAALIPDTAYGNVCMAAFQQAAARRNLRTVGIERFGGAVKPEDAVTKLLPALAGADSLFMPANAAEMPALAAALMKSNVNTGKITPFGTGVWNEPGLFRLPQLQGARYAAPDGIGFQNFAARYAQRFNAQPIAIATLAYDAVSLAIGLNKNFGARRFAEDILTNASGFTGADGLFRFRTDGTNDRGLAVLEIKNGAKSIIAQAPKSFEGS